MKGVQRRARLHLDHKARPTYDRFLVVEAGQVNDFLDLVQAIKIERRFELLGHFTDVDDLDAKLIRCSPADIISTKHELD